MKSLIYSVCEEYPQTEGPGETWDHIAMRDKEWEAPCVLITWDPSYRAEAELGEGR